MHITLILKFGIIYGETLVFLLMCLDNAFVAFKRNGGEKKKTVPTKITAARLTMQKKKAFSTQANSVVCLRLVSITCKKGETTSMCSINSAIS